MVGDQTMKLIAWALTQLMRLNDKRYENIFHYEYSLINDQDNQGE
jgi:hypothetical protein